MKLRLSLFLVTGVAIVAAWYYLLLSPVHQNHARLKSELSSLQVQLEDYQATLNQLPVFLQTRDGLSRKITEINSRLFSRQEMLNLFDYVEQMVKSQDLRVIELAPHLDELLYLSQIPHTPGQPQSLSLDVKVSGDYLSFGQFVELLEKQAFFQRTDKCLISESPDKHGELLFNLQFKALLETAVEQS